MARYYALLFLSMLEYIYVYIFIFLKINPFLGFNGVCFTNPPVPFFLLLFKHGYYKGKRHFIIVCINGPREIRANCVIECSSTVGSVSTTNMNYYEGFQIGHLHMCMWLLSDKET